MKTLAASLRRLLPLVMISGWLLSYTAIPAAANHRALRTDPIELEIERLKASFTATERVGQLMMVTFEGTYLDPETAIYQLIADYNIGAVVLLASNDNINGQVNTPRLVQTLTADLQQLAAQAATHTGDRETPREYVPLFIATTHAGEGQPDTQITLGTTPLPSSMALGATWNPDAARKVGQIAGTELSAMGINMLLGPALDVYQRLPNERTFDLGVHSFGGEPYWVGKMGQAYITGVHEGSQGRIAVIAQNFPGLGLADTPPDQEIPVLPRAVEELRKFDLVPYHAVTGGARDPLARADGVQCANIRYQGENIRSITRPICIDEQAADQLLRLDLFRSWRETGLMISSPLGTRAIRRYYNSSPFPHRQVAREALLAGNDLLYLTDFGPASGEDQLENVIDVIEFFAEQYEDDPVFRARVDQSLDRILRLKLQLYGGDPSLNNVLTSPTNINTVGQSTTQLYSIAQQSITLVSPRRQSLPAPPGRNDTIVIFTDVRLEQQCSYCAAYPTISVNALEVAIERMYGPYAGAQIRPEQVISFSFDQLENYLHGTFEGLSAEDYQFKTNQRIGEVLRDVDWIVFVMLDISPDIESSAILRDLLETELAFVERAQIVVMAMAAPVYLSATEISKFTAYYALYSHTPPFIDAAARALFQETGLPGALPISLPAVGYDILEMTAPDPSQMIQIELDLDTPNGALSAITAPDILTAEVGERLVLRTSSILDRNSNPVPDGTPVEFTVTFLSENLQTRQSATTTDGVAYTSIKPNRPGRVQITASSVNAVRSATLQIVVVDGPLATQSGPPLLIPRASASESQSLPAASTTQNSPSATSVAQIDSDGGDDHLSGPSDQAPSDEANASTVGSLENEPDSRRLETMDFVVALFGLSLMAALGFSVGLMTMSVSGGIRVLLGSVVAGLTGYIYYGLGGPGAPEIADRLGSYAPLITALGSGLIGLIYTWFSLRSGRRR
mgnify:CR=1 FL=1